MSCVAGNLDIKRLIRCSFGDNNTRLVRVVENNSICDMPWGAVKIRCATKTSFFLYSENDHQGGMWQTLFNRTSNNFQDNRNPSSIIGSKICSAITKKDPISEYGLVS